MRLERAGRSLRRGLGLSIFPSILVGIFALALPLGIGAQGFVEGKHYTIVTPAVKTEAPKGKVEVREFFWYGCPHCFSLEPHIVRWKRNAPKNVHFVQTPAVLGERWAAHAYTFYALDEMNLLETLHSLFFKALHVDRARLNDMSSIGEFFATKGVDRARFENIYKSFSVSNRVKKAERLAMLYQVRGVPLLTVNGRYIVQMSSLTSFQQLSDLLDYLVRKEAARSGQ